MFNQTQKQKTQQSMAADFTSPISDKEKAKNDKTSASINNIIAENTRILNEDQTTMNEKTKDTFASFTDYAELKKKTLTTAKASFQKKMFNDLVFLGLSECYYHSLVLDESYKQSHEKRLKQKAYAFYQKTNAAGILSDTPKTPIIKSIVVEASRVAKELTEGYYKEETMPADYVGNTLDAYVSFVVESAEDYVTLVRTKVEAAIKNEAAYTNGLEMLKESNPVQHNRLQNKKHATTLMESITKMLVKKIVVETTVETVNMSDIFGETVEYYTMLENLHTSRMIDIDIDTLNNNIRNAAVKFEDLN